MGLRCRQAPASSIDRVEMAGIHAHHAQRQGELHILARPACGFEACQCGVTRQSRLGPTTACGAICAKIIGWVHALMSDDNSLLQAGRCALPSAAVDIQIAHNSVPGL